MAIQGTSIESLATDIFHIIRSYNPQIDLKKIREAYEFAKQAHMGQLRKSGEPYLVHPLRTVQILAHFHVDKDTLIAAFLHDVPEDTEIPLREIERLFGEKIAFMVDGITKLSKVHYRERMEQRQIESLKKLFIHSATDLRVILIKLADRLDNMRTIRFIADEKKRMRIARETLEIYVPIANLLGIGEIRMELEDLCFEHLYPVDHANLKREVEENIEERNFILEEMTHLTEKELHKQNIAAEIIGRPKTLYSIFRKLQTKQTIYNIEDLIAIRVIVNTREDCYHVLGILHRLFKPKTGRIKDYIAVPKPNGYQSVHTTVFGINGSVVEFQIRTRYMHMEAEYGVAAHYFYKYESEQELTNIMQQRTSWVQRILEIQKENENGANFLENLKLDVFQDRIFVFSPKGDVIDLPRGACVLDFAYAIHTDIGNHALKAEINGIVHPVTATLGSGDTVRVMTGREARPEREWLNFAKTNVATHRIKDFLKREPAEKKFAAGKKLLQKEFERMGKNISSELSPKKLRLIASRISCHSLDDLYIGVGEGSVNPQDILEILFEKEHLESEGFFNRIRRQHIKRNHYNTKVGLRITGDNGRNQFREITRILNGLKIPIIKFQIDRPWYMDEDRCRLEIIVKNYSELSQVFESLETLDGVRKISRRLLYKKIPFIMYALFTGAVWLLHPFLVSAYRLPENLIYIGILMLFLLAYYFKRLTRRSFPELAETRYFWPLVFGLNTLAFFTVIGELMVFDIHFNWVMAVSFIIGVYAMLTASYIKYRREIKEE